MELIKNYIFSICGAGAVVSAAKIILHNSKLTKTVNIFLSLFLLFYMAAPFGKADTDTFFDDLKKTEESETYPNENYADFIKFTVDKVCAEQNCAVEKTVIHEKEKDGEKVIDFIEIELNDKSKAENISEILKNEYGFEVSVS